MLPLSFRLIVSRAWQAENWSNLEVEGRYNRLKLTWVSCLKRSAGVRWRRRGRQGISKVLELIKVIIQ